MFCSLAKMIALKFLIVTAMVNGPETVNAFYLNSLNRHLSLMGKPLHNLFQMPIIFDGSALLFATPIQHSASGSQRSSIYVPPFITANYHPINLNARPIYTAHIPLFGKLITDTKENNPFNKWSTNTKVRSNVFSKRVDMLPTKTMTNYLNVRDRHYPCPVTISDIQSNRHNENDRQLSSENVPVYILPPKNFQPIIYQQNEQPVSLSQDGTNFFPSFPLIYHENQQQPVHSFQPQFEQQLLDEQPKKVKNPEAIWYKNGAGNNDGDKSTLKPNKHDSSGMNALNKNKIMLVPASDANDNVDNVPLLEASVWHEVNTDGQQPNLPTTSGEFNEASTSTTPTGEPITAYTTANPNTKSLETTISNLKNIVSASLNPYSQEDLNSDGSNVYPTYKKNDNKDNYKTKLPVGMSSFFLGGSRGVSGRHWNMPTLLVNRLEFMPNNNPLKNQYFPEESAASATPDNSVINESGQPEKEESTLNKENGNDNFNNKSIKKDLFSMNTIFDSDEDLLAEESTQQLISQNDYKMSTATIATESPNAPAIYPQPSK